MTATPMPAEETLEALSPELAASLVLLEARYLRLAAELHEQNGSTPPTNFALRDLSPFGR